MTDDQKKLVKDNISVNALPRFFQLIDKYETDIISICKDGLYETEIEILLQNDSWQNLKGYFFKQKTGTKKVAVYAPFYDESNNTIIYKTNNNLFTQWKDYRTNYVIVTSDGTELTIKELFDALKGFMSKYDSNTTYDWANKTTDRINMLMNLWNTASSTTATQSDLSAIKRQLTTNATDYETTYQNNFTAFSQIRTNVNGITYKEYYQTARDYINAYYNHAYLINGHYGIMNVLDTVISDDIVYNIDKLGSGDLVVDSNGTTITYGEENKQLTYNSLFADFYNIWDEELEGKNDDLQYKNKDEDDKYNINSVLNLSPWYGYRKMEKDGTTIKLVVDSNGKFTYYYPLIKVYCSLIAEARRKNYVNWVNNYLTICATILGKDNYDKYFNTSTGLLAKYVNGSMDALSVQKEILNMGEYFDDASIQSETTMVYEPSYTINLLSKKLILLDTQTAEVTVDSSTGETQYVGVYETNVKRNYLKKMEKSILDFIQFLLTPNTYTTQIKTESTSFELSLDLLNKDIDWGVNQTESINTFKTSVDKINEFKKSLLSELYLNKYDLALNNANNYYKKVVTFSTDYKVKNLPIYYKGYDHFCKTYKYLLREDVMDWFKQIPYMSKEEDFANSDYYNYLTNTLCNTLFMTTSQESDTNPITFGSNKSPCYGYYPFVCLLPVLSYNGANLYINLIKQITTYLTYVTTWFTRSVSPWFNKYEPYLLFYNLFKCYEHCKSSPKRDNVTNPPIDYVSMGITADYNCVSTDFNMKSQEGGYLMIDMLNNNIQQRLGFMLNNEKGMYNDDENALKNAGADIIDILGGYVGRGEGFVNPNMMSIEERYLRNSYVSREELSKNKEAFSNKNNNGGIKQYIKEAFSNNSMYITYNKYEIIFELLQAYTGSYQKYISTVLKILAYYGMYMIQCLNNSSASTKYYTKKADNAPIIDYTRKAFTQCINSFEQYILNTNATTSTTNTAKVILFNPDWEANKEMSRFILTISSLLTDFDIKVGDIKPWTQVNTTMAKSALKAPVTEANANIGEFSLKQGQVVKNAEVSVLSKSLFEILSKVYTLTNKVGEKDTEYANYGVSNSKNYNKELIQAKEQLENSTSSNDVSYVDLYNKVKSLETELYNALSSNKFMLETLISTDSGCYNAIEAISRYCKYVSFILHMEESNASLVTSGLFDYTIVEPKIKFTDKSSDAEYTYEWFDTLVTRLYHEDKSSDVSPITTIADHINKASAKRIQVDLSQYKNTKAIDIPFHEKYPGIKSGISKRGMLILYAALANCYMFKTNMDNATNYNIYKLYDTYMHNGEESPFYELNASADTGMDQYQYQYTESFGNNYNNRGFNNSFYNKLMNNEFNIYKYPSKFGVTEYFISPKTGRKVFTYLNGQKQPVNYKAHGVTKEAFINFINRQNSSQVKQQQRPSAIVRPSDKEGFVSTGSMGASYNKSMDTITGPALFTDQILRNGQTWKDLHDRVDKTGVATDGPDILGGGPGNGYDQAMKSHIKNMEILESANNEFNTPEILKQVNKNINNDLGSTPVNSLYNRGNQTKAKIIELQDRAVGVLPERFYPERTKNRNIYKTNEIIPIAGFDVAEARMGEEATKTHSVAYLKRNHGRRLPNATPTGALLEQQFGGVVPPAFSATIGEPQNNNKEGFASMPTVGENNLDRQFTGVEGGKYWMPKKFVH